MLFNLRGFLILSDFTWTVAMSVAGVSIVGRYPMTSCETWTLLQTEIWRPAQLLTSCFSLAWSRTNIWSKFFFLAFAKMCSDVTSANACSRTMVVGQLNLSKDQCSLLCLGLLNSWCLREDWAKMLVLDAIPLTRCEVPAIVKVSSSLSMLSQASVVWTYGCIFSGKGTSLSCAKAIFCRQSTVLISSVCKYAIPMPTAV